MEPHIEGVGSGGAESNLMLPLEIEKKLT